MNRTATMLETNIDRRRAARINVQARVPLLSRFVPLGEGTLLDLSEKGAFLLSTEKLMRSSTISIMAHLTAGDVSRQCILPGRVVRVEEQGSAALTGYGVEFVGLSKATMQVLKSFVDFHAKKPAGKRLES